MMFEKKSSGRFDPEMNHTNVRAVVLPRHTVRTVQAILLAWTIPFFGAGLSASETVDPEAYDHPVRVACAGDSITEGVGVVDRAKDSYPAQLQAILGPKWAVTNFGVGGRTLLRKADPFDIGRALKSKPDAVVIMLGTNDSRQGTWDKFGTEFTGDYGAIIEKFKALDSHPRIWICCPVPVFRPNYGISESILTDKVIPAVTEVAKNKEISLIDLHTALLDQKANFPDGVHPNSQAARRIAEAVATALSGSAATKK
jgi:acyl-CoA thioesterase-1